MPNHVLEPVGVERGLEEDPDRLEAGPVDRFDVGHVEHDVVVRGIEVVGVADDLAMGRVADENQVASGSESLAGFDVDVANEGAGRVEDVEAAPPGKLVRRGWHAVRRKHDGRLDHVLDAVDGTQAAPFHLPDHTLVVDELTQDGAAAPGVGEPPQHEIGDPDTGAEAVRSGTFDADHRPTDSTTENIPRKPGSVASRSDLCSCRNEQ